MNSFSDEEKRMICKYEHTLIECAKQSDQSGVNVLAINFVKLDPGNAMAFSKHLIKQFGMYKEVYKRDQCNLHHIARLIGYLYCTSLIDLDCKLQHYAW